jgi:cytochrome c oxidase cbb3-type subunit 3
MGRIIKGLLAAGVLGIAGCTAPGKPDYADRPIPSDQVVSFKLLYGENCAGCHGSQGKMGGAPPLNDPLFRALIPAKELTRVITHGRKGTQMPAFGVKGGGSLTDAQIQILVNELKGVSYKATTDEASGVVTVAADTSGLQPAWGAPAAVPAGAPAYLAGTEALAVPSAQPIPVSSAERGAAVFKRACADCHGDGGKGTEGKEGTPENVVNDPVTLSLLSDQVLRRIIITGRPDFDMPGYNGPRPGDKAWTPLTDQEVNDLVQLLASWRQHREAK